MVVGLYGCNVVMVAVVAIAVFSSKRRKQHSDAAAAQVSNGKRVGTQGKLDTRLDTRLNTATRLRLRLD